MEKMTDSWCFHQFASQTEHGCHFEGTSPAPILHVGFRAGFAQIFVHTVNICTVTFVRLLYLTDKANRIHDEFTLKAR